MSPRRNPRAVPGTCFACGCTWDRACYGPRDRQPCSWADGDRTLCTACVRIYGRVRLMFAQLSISPGHVVGVKP